MKSMGRASGRRLSGSTPPQVRETKTASGRRPRCRGAYRCCASPASGPCRGRRCLPIGATESPVAIGRRGPGEVRGRDHLRELVRPGIRHGGDQALLHGREEGYHADSSINDYECMKWLSDRRRRVRCYPGPPACTTDATPIDARNETKFTGILLCWCNLPASHGMWSRLAGIM